jgi:hypothetical protein
MDDFEEEFYEPDNLREDDKAFLERYYEEVLSALISTGYAADSGKEELVPYEVVVYSDQPGILYTK